MALNENVSLETKFVPPTIRHPDKPLSFLKFLRTANNNPIAVWPKQIFENPYVTRTWMGHTVHFIASPALLKGVFFDHHDNFPRGVIQDRVLTPAMGEGLLTSSGEVWKRQRRAASPAFRIDNLRSMVPVMWRAGKFAVEQLQSTNTRALRDVHPVMTLATLEVIIDLLLGGDDSGIDREEIAKTVSIYRDTVGKVDVPTMLGVPNWVPKPWTKPGKCAIEAMRTAADSVIKTRRALSKRQTSETPDLLDLMLTAQDPESGERFSDIELRDNIMTFISAGHETTALVLTWALYLIANDQDVQTRLHKEASTISHKEAVDYNDIESMTYHLQVVREAMRLFPPVPVRSNQALADIEIDGLKIRKGDHIACLIYAAHRHQNLWKNPATFDPGNFSAEAMKTHERFQFLPFGGGLRICIAMKMAELEAVAVLAALVSQLEFFPNPDHIPMPRLRITASPIGGMPLYVRRRA